MDLVLQTDLLSALFQDARFGTKAKEITKKKVLSAEEAEELKQKEKRKREREVHIQTSL